MKPIVYLFSFALLMPSIGGLEAAELTASDSTAQAPSYKTLGDVLRALPLEVITGPLGEKREYKTRIYFSDRQSLILIIQLYPHSRLWDIALIEDSEQAILNNLKRALFQVTLTPADVDAPAHHQRFELRFGRQMNRRLEIIWDSKGRITRINQSFLNSSAAFDGEVAPVEERSCSALITRFARH